MVRRDVLKASGTAIGIAGIGRFSQPVAASETSKSTAQTNLVRVSIRHKEIPELPTNNTDDFAKYRLNESDSEVHFTRWAPDRAFSIAKNNDFTVVNGSGEFNKISNANYGGGRSETAPVNATKELVLEQPYRTPVVHVERESSQVVTARVSGESITAQPGEELKLKLGLRKAKGREKSVGTKEVPDPRRKGEKLEVPKRGELRTYSLRPIITLKNYGTMEVFAAQ